MGFHAVSAARTRSILVYAKDRHFWTATTINAKQKTYAVHIQINKEPVMTKTATKISCVLISALCAALIQAPFTPAVVITFAMFIVAAVYTVKRQYLVAAILVIINGLGVYGAPGLFAQLMHGNS